MIKLVCIALILGLVSKISSNGNTVQAKLVKKIVNKITVELKKRFLN